MTKSPRSPTDAMERVVHSTGKKVFLRTFFQVMAPVSLMLAVLFSIVFGLLLPLLEKSHLAERKENCKNLVSVQLNYLNTLNGDVEEGKVDLLNAQTRALTRFRSFRFGNGDYFWIFGPERTLLMHPYRPDLEGIRPESLSGLDGTLLKQHLALAQTAVASPEGGGFFEHRWYFKSGLHTVEPKMYYVALFKPWNWIVGTGVFFSDAAAAIAEWRRRFIGAGVLSIAVAGVISLYLSLRASRLEEKASRAALLDQSFRQKTLELAYSESQLALITQIYRNALEGVVITDREGRILETNLAFCSITGYTPEELAGKGMDIIRSGKHGPDFYQQMKEALDSAGQWTGEIWDRRKNGEAFPARLNIFQFSDGDNKPIRYIGVLQDLSELHQSRDRLRHEISHDSLTGIPNRFLFRDRLSLAISRARDKGELLTVAMIGLDRFGAVNKTVGYSAGDGLLQEAAKRLMTAAEESGAVARFGGDEYVILLTRGDSPASYLRRVERMLASLRVPFIIDGSAHRITASAGVTFFPRDGHSPDSLLQNASLAMERAKREGGNAWRLFTEDLDKKTQQRMRLEGELRRGIDGGEFHLHYQPKVSLQNHRTTGVEALLRWTPENGPIISPTVFIPMAEEIGEIRALGLFAMERACLQLREWADRGFNLSMAVNISAKQMADDSFVQDVLDTVKWTEANPFMLKLEITESAFMENPDHAQAVMSRLGEEGIQFSLDDFGTGFSSLSRLRLLPISELKIDRSFVTDMDNEKTRGVTSTVVHLAHSLQMGLTFEGVETKTQLDSLKSLIPPKMDTCVQGYLFSRPLPPERIPLFIASELPEVF